jgi:hypothetical protein
MARLEAAPVQSRGEIRVFQHLVMLCGFLFGLREMLAHAKSDEEKEDLKGQLAELSRQTARMRPLYVHEIGVPVLFLLVFVLLAVYLIQRA